MRVCYQKTRDMMSKIVIYCLYILKALAIIVAMMPSVVTRYTERKCHVVLQGEARGLIAIDWLGKMKTNYKIDGTVSLIVAVD